MSSDKKSGTFHNIMTKEYIFLTKKLSYVIHKMYAEKNNLLVKKANSIIDRINIIKPKYYGNLGYYGYYN